MPQANTVTVGTTDGQDRLAAVVDMMREMSRQTDPQAMVAAYGKRVRQLLPTDGMVSLSRRGLEWPHYRVTRSSRWEEPVNPWREKERLPMLEGGLLAELLYGDEPRILDDPPVGDDDPARTYLEGFRSFMALPLYDQGVALNMVVFMRRLPAAFATEELPQTVWMSNLFGRATHNLVLSEQLREAYRIVDHEMEVIARIQRSLLPRELPAIPTMELAAYYETSRQAGGDHYDFFPLPDGRWGILIADASGHGTPAAVIMAITHSIAHAFPGPPEPPGQLFEFINSHLTEHYTGNNGSFVTAFYAIYDPSTRALRYASAGHPPPRVKRPGRDAALALDGAQGLPLGIAPGERYAEQTAQLEPGDQLVLYTDGITEAADPSGEQFGTERVDAVLAQCRSPAQCLRKAVLGAVNAFTQNAPPADDRTIVLARIS